MSIFLLSAENAKPTSQNVFLLHVEHNFNKNFEGVLF